MSILTMMGGGQGSIITAGGATGQVAVGGSVPTLAVRGTTSPASALVANRGAQVIAADMGSKRLYRYSGGAFVQDVGDFTADTVTSVDFIDSANGLWFVSTRGGVSAKVYMSASGVGTWAALTLPSTPSSFSFKGVAYGNGKYVISGAEASGNDCYIWHSTDAVTWARVTLSAANSVSSGVPGKPVAGSTAYGNGRFLIGRNGGYITSASDSDVTTWADVAVASGVAIYPAWSPPLQKWAAMDAGGSIFVSTNGTSWSLGASSGTANRTHNAFKWSRNGFFVGSGTYVSPATTGIAYSADGTSISLASIAISATGVVAT